MTFALLRAGLPNSAVAIALALLPFVALALTPSQRAPQAPAVQMIAVSVVNGAVTVPN